MRFAMNLQHLLSINNLFELIQRIMVIMIIYDTFDNSQ